MVKVRYLSQLPNRASLDKAIAKEPGFKDMYRLYEDDISSCVEANEKMPNTLRALTNRMICTEIMSHLPDLQALHRVTQVNTFFYDVFKNDEERIKVQVCIDQMDLETFRYAVVASKCKDVAIYDEAETQTFLEAYLLPRPDGYKAPPPARTSFAPNEQYTLVEVVKYDKQVRYLANKYAETEPPKPWEQNPMTKERLMKAFLLFRIMYTMFPILHTHDNPFTSKGYQGNKRNRSCLARALPENDFADMLIIESWLKRQCKPILERFFEFVPWPFDDCPKHNPKPVMDGPCAAYGEFVMTAGLGHLIRILRGQGFRYSEHLAWVQAHGDHGAVATTYAADLLAGCGAAPGCGLATAAVFDDEKDEQEEEEDNKDVDGNDQDVEMVDA